MDLHVFLPSFWMRLNFKDFPSCLPSPLAAHLLLSTSGAAALLPNVMGAVISAAIFTFTHTLDVTYPACHRDKARVNACVCARALLFAKCVDIDTGFCLPARSSLSLRLCLSFLMGESVRSALSLCQRAQSFSLGSLKRKMHDTRNGLAHGKVLPASPSYLSLLEFVDFVLKLSFFLQRPKR